MVEKKEFKPISFISERFCAKLDDNAVIVTTQTEFGRVDKCLCHEKCKAECELRKKEL